MEALQQSYSFPRAHRVAKKTFIARFIDWCKAQEQNRLFWLAAILTVHACVITPLLLFLIMLTGNNIVLWFPAMASMTMCLVVNLAALPTKITIPVFFLSLLIDLVIIGGCIAAGFNIPDTF